MGGTLGQEGAVAVNPLTPTQRLARDLDKRLAATPRSEWAGFVEDAAVVIAAQWSGDVDGSPACPDCRRYASYGSHACSCPTGKVRKRMGAMVAARMEAV
jgi:hypothetical protein